MTRPGWPCTRCGTPLEARYAPPDPFDPRSIDEDKRLQVFADAIRYETVRYAPDTPEGLATIRVHCRPDLFHMGFSKSKDNVYAWMKTRGWK